MGKIRPRLYRSRGNPDEPTPDFMPATGPEPPTGVLDNYRPPSSFGARPTRNDLTIIKKQYKHLEGALATNRAALAKAQDTIVNYHRNRFNYRYNNPRGMNYSLQGFINSANERYLRYRQFDDEITEKFYETQGLFERVRGIDRRRRRERRGGRRHGIGRTNLPGRGRRSR